MKAKARILIVDDDKDVLLATRLFLKQHGFHVDTEERPVFVNQIIKNGNYDLVLLDMNFSRKQAVEKKDFTGLTKS